LRVFSTRTINIPSRWRYVKAGKYRSYTANSGNGPVTFKILFTQKIRSSI
jgi:hypothetical protein